MIIAGEYSFNNGREEVSKKYPDLLKEIKDVIESVDASLCRTKKSLEKTMPGQVLYSPRELNKTFKENFYARNWGSVRVPCEYSTEFYTNEYSPDPLNQGAFREMDFVKERLGVEVHFGKYAFMVYSGCAKMTIFHKLDKIDLGVEIVPLKDFANEMSTGVSYFEQFVWDLQHRGVADIDIPVLILGVDK